MKISQMSNIYGRRCKISEITKIYIIETVLYIFEGRMSHNEMNEVSLILIKLNRVPVQYYFVLRRKTWLIRFLHSQIHTYESILRSVVINLDIYYILFLGHIKYIQQWQPYLCSSPITLSINIYIIDFLDERSVGTVEFKPLSLSKHL